MLPLVHDADAFEAGANPCGWVTPDIWRDENAGKIAVRFTCSGCGAVGGWAIGLASSIAALADQARALGPHAG